MGAVVCNVNIARSIHGDANRTRTILRAVQHCRSASTGGDLLHFCGRAVGKEDIACSIHCNSVYGSASGLDRDLRGRTERSLRRLADTVNRRASYQVAIVVVEFHRAQAQTGRQRSKAHVHVARSAAGGSGAGAAATQLEVEAGDALRHHLDRAHGLAGSQVQVVGQRDIGAGARPIRRSRQADAGSPETLLAEARGHIHRTAHRQQARRVRSIARAGSAPA